MSFKANMNIAMEKNDVIFGETVKTTNDNRIKLIEDAIAFIENRKFLVKIDHYEFYLILDEAISNAMEHGNHWNLEKHVYLRILHPENNRLEIDIEDEGSGFDPDVLPEKANGMQTLSPRGRGILIIKKFCNASWSNNGKTIKMSLALQD